MYATLGVLGYSLVLSFLMGPGHPDGMTGTDQFIGVTRVEVVVFVSYDATVRMALIRWCTPQFRRIRGGPPTFGIRYPLGLTGVERIVG